MEIYKKLLTYVPEKKFLAIFAVFLTTIATVFQFITFWYLYQFLNALIVNRNTTEGKHAAYVIAGLLLAYGISYFFSLIATHIVAFRLESNLKKLGL